MFSCLLLFLHVLVPSLKLSRLHDKPVIKSSVLKLVREMDDDKQQQHPAGGAAALGVASSKTGRTQNTTPWMKTSGVRSPYNVYKQVDEEQTPLPPATYQQQTPLPPATYQQNTTTTSNLSATDS